MLLVPRWPVPAEAGTAGAGTAGAGTAGAGTAGSGSAGAGTAGAGTTTPQPPPADWQDALITIGHFNEAVIVRSRAKHTAGQDAPCSGSTTRWSKSTPRSAESRRDMHAPSFQALEATWRSLASLVANTETARCSAQVFNTRRDELSRDLETAAEFDQSLMFKLVYEGEYGTLGGNPYSLLLTDSRSPTARSTSSFSSKMTQVAAAAHAPLIAGAAPAMFALQDFSQLGKRAICRKSSKALTGIPQRLPPDRRLTVATLVLAASAIALAIRLHGAPVGFNYIEDISSTGVRPRRIRPT